ncbi:phage protein Gp36 family protein [Ruegeria sp. HKCCD8929]|uniref:phage protein Gp36 family protein n=1 Tax=Ruegeria sp. HKCCD8929 TaxID=2683006 RepID=UPI001489F872|nr:phage protein Gp36 family protein [Ruegeria sp. HKCCD8929]
MGRFLTSNDFIAQFGETEAQLIAGTGAFNSLEGSQIDVALIDREIAFVDELIAGFVLARHDWLRALNAGDMPNLLKGLGGDIVRYRLRDKKGSQGQITDTVEARYKAAVKALEAIGDGKLDLIRDRKDGVDLDTPETPDAIADLPSITGGAPQASDILKGY